MQRPKSYDKQITRWANMGFSHVIMFGKRWPLTPGYYRVKYNRARPADSIIEPVRLPLPA